MGDKEISTVDHDLNAIQQSNDRLSTKENDYTSNQVYPHQVSLEEMNAWFASGD